VCRYVSAADDKRAETFASARQSELVLHCEKPVNQAEEIKHENMAPAAAVASKPKQENPALDALDEDATVRQSFPGHHVASEAAAAELRLQQAKNAAFIAEEEHGGDGANLIELKREVKGIVDQVDTPSAVKADSPVATLLPLGLNKKDFEPNVIYEDINTLDTIPELETATETVVVEEEKQANAVNHRGRGKPAEYSVAPSAETTASFNRVDTVSAAAEFKCVEGGDAAASPASPSFSSPSNPATTQQQAQQAHTASSGQQPGSDASASRLWNMPVVSSSSYGHPILRLLALCMFCTPWAVTIWGLTPLLSNIADYAVAPSPDREAYLHVGVGPGGTTLCRTRVYAYPVARPMGTTHNLTRPWHSVNYRLLYSLVARELWAGGEDRPVDRIHFELTTSTTARPDDRLTEESRRWMWVERAAWGTVSITWYSLFTGTLLNPRTLNLIVSVGDAENCPSPSSATDAAATARDIFTPSTPTSPLGINGTTSSVEWRRSITAAYLVDLSRTYLTMGRQRDEGLTGLVLRQPHDQQESGMDELLLEESERFGAAILRPVWWYQDFRLTVVLVGTSFAGAVAAAAAVWGVVGMWARFRCRRARRLQTRLVMLRRDRCVPLTDGNYLIYVPKLDESPRGAFINSVAKIIGIQQVSAPKPIDIVATQFRDVLSRKFLWGRTRIATGSVSSASSKHLPMNSVAPACLASDGHEKANEAAANNDYDGLTSSSVKKPESDVAVALHDPNDAFDEHCWANFYCQDIFGNILALHSVVHHKGSMLDVHRALLGLSYVCTPVSKGEGWRVRLLRKARNVGGTGDAAAEVGQCMKPSLIQNRLPTFDSSKDKIRKR
jgi:hypothetical protein